MSIVQFRQGSDLATSDTRKGPSPNLWYACPSPQELIEGPRYGYGNVWGPDRFLNSRAFTVPTTEANFNEYKGFSDTGGAMAIASAAGGGIILSSDDDNEGASIADVTLPFKIIRGGGSLWFEASVQTSTIADTKVGFVIGLWEQQTLSATVPIAAAGTLADANFVGFHRLEGDGDQIDIVYKANGVTQVSQTDAQTLVADTAMKLGFYYDDASFVLTYFANGIKIGTPKTIPTAAGTDFPNDVLLGKCFAVLNAAGSSPGTVTCNWWRAVQLFP